MGTKNNPGASDCYENADPDEPMFVLLARDALAPHVVRFWADLREETRGTLNNHNVAKVTEARSCADAMENWRANGGGS